MSWPYEYIIIGAGSAGCAIANRLGEDHSHRILILEAGPPDDNFKLKMPAGFASLGEKSPFNWRYETTPQKHCNDRRMYWPRGKTLGGSSAINAMLYVRGHAWDYDHWRQLGNEGWSYEDVLPFFRKAENNERLKDDFHGQGGPLNVAEQHNVHVVSNAMVERIIFDQDRAMGIRYRHKGQDEVARCSREIILCGGTVNSPQLLMLSGVGPADHLKSLGIQVVQDLPGVGGNLQDHLDAAILQYARPRTTYGRSSKLMALYRYLRKKEGPGTSPIAESGGFIRTRDGLAAPDVQYHFLPVLVIDHGRTQVRKDGYSLHACVLRPESKGTIRLASKDPNAHPLIDANYLAERRDLDTLIEGVKKGRDILAQAGLDPYRGAEFEPGPAARTDAEIEAWIRAKAETIYHPVGTCKMGPDNDPMAVVDNQCRVRGLKGLRVVDASVMPTLVGGNTNAPTIMIAERVAAFMQAAA